MKKVVLIGKKGSGKSTLCKKLDKLDNKCMIMQSVELEDIFKSIYDESTENEDINGIFNRLEAQTKLIALVYDPTQVESQISPDLAKKFSTDVIGIITKIKKCESSINIQIGRERLEMAGVNKIFEIDTKEEIGLDELFNYICL